MSDDGSALTVAIGDDLVNFDFEGVVGFGEICDALNGFAKLLSLDGKRSGLVVKIFIGVSELSVCLFKLCLEGSQSCFSSELLLSERSLELLNQLLQFLS